VALPVEGLLKPINCINITLQKDWSIVESFSPGIEDARRRDGHQAARGSRNGIFDEKGLEALGTALQTPR